MIPTTHHGAWQGPNRLWFEDPTKPERCDGKMDAGDNTLRYSWSFRGEPQEGELTLDGPAGSLKGTWRDSWHMKEATVFHGCFHDGQLVLYGTYPAGEGKPSWGWRIELDARDPEHLVLKMFNLLPDNTTVQAVDLRGGRA